MEKKVRSEMLLRSVTLAVTLTWFGLIESSRDNEDHGGVVMGVPNDRCDNGQWMIEEDVDSHQFLCQENERHSFPGSWLQEREECLAEEDIPRPMHRCMTTQIVYEDQPPRAGPHRPLWPRYGEYSYLPPQRWVHSLEHGAAVFLYHPCAPPSDVTTLRRIAARCAEKRILTPYRTGLTRERPFAVIIYGCRLLLGNPDENAIARFLENHSKTAPESGNLSDGQYEWELVEPAVPYGSASNEITCRAIKSPVIE